MKVELNRFVVATDIDDTLIIWDSKSKDLTADTKDRLVVQCPYTGKPYSFIVHERHVEFLRREKAKGSFVIAWSRSEALWAEAVIKALNLEDSIDLVMSKPVKVLDDKENLNDIVGTVLFLPITGHSV